MEIKFKICLPYFFRSIFLFLQFSRIQGGSGRGVGFFFFCNSPKELVVRSHETL